MNHTRVSVVPNASQVVESWERTAAGIEDRDMLRPSIGILAGFSISLPVDALLVLWVFA